MSRLGLIAIGTLALNASAFAAGIDSRSYTCANLHGLIGVQGFVFISQPFGDFVVASGYYCSGGQVLQLRSVPTLDNPQCPVNYCTGREKLD
jgi:hypothetical protein